MITPGYSVTATERVLPRLALDFTTASLDSRVTVTRSLNTATRVNSSGYVETVNADLPRFDFDPSTLICKGLLIEETRQNLILQSANVTVSPWTNSKVNLTADAQTAPDNTLSADRVYEDNTSGQHAVYQSVGTGAAATYYTLSGYFKNDGARYIVLAIYEGSTGSNILSGQFDLQTGNITYARSGAGPTPVGFIFPAANGFSRCVLTILTGSGGPGMQAQVWMNRAGVYTSNPYAYTGYAGDGSSGYYHWGTQLEVGQFATSYIPTTTTSLTRNADIVSMTGTNFSSWYNASEGAFLVQSTLFSGAYPNNANLISVVDTTLTDTLRFWVWSGAANNLRWTETEGGAQQFDLTRTYTANTSFKALATYKANSFAFALNGGAITSTASGLVITSADGLIIGSKTGFTEFMSGHVAKIMYWPQRITNAEVQAFSK